MVAADGGSGPRDRTLGTITAARSPSIRIAREKSSSSASDRHPVLCPQSTPSTPRRFAWARRQLSRSARQGEVIMKTTAASQAAETTAANPKVLGGVAPYLSVKDASAAAEFYKRAFGAEEVARKSMQDHRLIHCHLYINGASVMLSDAFPEFGHPLKDPQGFNLLLAVDDVDAWWRRGGAAAGGGAGAPE